ncbi:uncharacterized protein LOC127813989 [Diospyros lotus]|uniref:uncharacterized protein LOC127813989 n=1 Tax=Diospyros lotus TaxID=55363 RepID=UPI00224D061B|nr:uncharacterized protein LOC127813989 [Diospyros lotus]
MAAAVESPTPDNLNKESKSPSFSPASDRHFWSALQSRVDSLLENRKPFDPSFPAQLNSGESDGAKRIREDSLLLLKGFDSVAYSLSQLSKNLDNALQGARDLARPPTMTEIYQCAMETAKSIEEEEPEENKEEQRGLKRKVEVQECSESDEQGHNSEKQNQRNRNEEEGKLKKAKNVAISMATKAASLARELKAFKSDLSFMQDRCALLEEENRRLRHGFSSGIQPEEDDLVRLQLEALLAEKSRLATENANLTRENQCLRQLVEYHQITSEEFSASYDDVIRELSYEFSPPPLLPEEEDNANAGGKKDKQTPPGGLCFDEERSGT